MFVKAAGAFAADVRVANVSRDPAKDASAKSVIGVMGLAIARGNRIRLTATGADAEAAVTALVDLVASGLGEEIADA